MILAADLIAPGGPSVPVWTFFGILTTGVLTLIGQQIAARRTAAEAKVKAAEAAANSKKAQENTQALSNGFADSTSSSLNRIIRSQDELRRGQEDLGKALREHLEWHLDRKE